MHNQNWCFEVELDGQLCPKRMRQAERPTTEEARGYFEALGYTVGHIKAL